jgi:hypothetical protein
MPPVVYGPSSATAHPGQQCVHNRRPSNSAVFPNSAVASTSEAFMEMLSQPW